MKKKKIFAKICGGCLLLSAIGIVNVYAADYTGYALPARQGNNYTTQHEKETADNYIYNKVVDLENTSTVTFWAANSNKKQISDDYDQKLGNNSKIKFTASGYDAVGEEVMLGMENAKWYWFERAFVAGEVDFR